MASMCAEVVIVTLSQEDIYILRVFGRKLT